DPNNIGGERRFAERSDSGEFLNAVVTREGVLVGHLAENGELVAVGAIGEIAPKTRPGIAAIGRAEEEVAAVINGVVIVRRDVDGRIPLKTVRMFASLGLRLEGAFLAAA